MSESLSTCHWLGQFLPTMETVPDKGYLETIQRRATKFILNDYSSDYKSRLTKLNMLPLMMTLELNDIIFFLKSISSGGNNSFDIVNRSV